MKYSKNIKEKNIIGTTNIVKQINMLKK